MSDKLEVRKTDTDYWGIADQDGFIIIDRDCDENMEIKLKEIVKRCNAYPKLVELLWHTDKVFNLLTDRFPTKLINIPKDIKALLTELNETGD